MTRSTFNRRIAFYLFQALLGEGEGCDGADAVALLGCPRIIEQSAPAPVLPVASRSMAVGCSLSHASGQRSPRTWGITRGGVR